MAQAARIPDIAGLLAVSECCIERWTSDVRKHELQERQERAWDLWLNCMSQREIAELVEVTQPAISGWLDKFATDVGNLSPPASRQHFQNWSFATADKDAGAQSYFGAMPPHHHPRALRPGGLPAADHARRTRTDASP